MDIVHGALPVLLGRAVLQAFSGYLQCWSAQGCWPCRRAKTGLCILHSRLKAGVAPAYGRGHCISGRKRSSSRDWMCISLQHCSR